MEMPGDSSSPGYDVGGGRGAGIHTKDSNLNYHFDKWFQSPLYRRNQSQKAGFCAGIPV